MEGNPQIVIDECHRLLKPGGIACHTICFFAAAHGYPSDIWRSTPNALRLLHGSWSSIINCDGWGDFDVWQIVKDGMRFENVPNAKWRPLHRVRAGARDDRRRNADDRRLATKRHTRNGKGLSVLKKPENVPFGLAAVVRRLSESGGALDVCKLLGK